MLLAPNLPEDELSGDKLEKISANLFQLLLEFRDFAIILISPEGIIMSWNMGAEFLYGFSAKEMIGKSISVFNSNEELTDKHENDLTITKDKGRFEYEDWKYRKNGSRFYANAVLTALYDADGILQGYAKVTHDLTRQKSLEQENLLLNGRLEEMVKVRTRELEIVNKELEAFSYSVSHDLRTPLRAIDGYANMLKEDYAPTLDQEANRIIDVITDNTKMMGRLIDDLLSFSKMARLEIVDESINMNQLVANCVAEFSQVEDLSRYEFGLLSLSECRGDESMLKQVWKNLIGNAVKYSAKKETPQIEVGNVTDNHAHIYFVKDNGAGFDMKYAKNLFGVFQRLHRQDEFEGNGLGLALAKRIVTKHGGEIWVESALNAGSVFYFSIPKNIRL